MITLNMRPQTGVWVLMDEGAAEVFEDGKQLSIWVGIPRHSADIFDQVEAWFGNWGGGRKLVKAGEWHRIEDDVLACELKRAS
jgi:hypothetical protein